VKWAHPLEITIDPFHFREVLENLLANALTYTAAFRSVTVIAEKRNNEELLISVKDTGVGIAKTDLGKLFTKFYRSESTSSSYEEGTGLGLYVAQSYAESWGGRITVKSQVGKGSVFIIHIPISNVNQGGEAK
jgi:signal transduction histidine kinase